MELRGGTGKGKEGMAASRPEFGVTVPERVYAKNTIG
jgi:hypothetical protein